MIRTFFNGLYLLYHHAKLGEDRRRALAVGANIWCLYVFCLYFCHASRPASCAFEGIYFEEVLCHSSWVDFDSVFTFLSRDCPFTNTRKSPFPAPQYS